MQGQVMAEDMVVLSILVTNIVVVEIEEEDTEVANSSIRENLGSKMGLIRKHASNKFLWAGIQETIEFQSNESTIMVELTYLS